MNPASDHINATWLALLRDYQVGYTGLQPTEENPTMKPEPQRTPTAPPFFAALAEARQYMLGRLTPLGQQLVDGLMTHQGWRVGIMALVTDGIGGQSGNAIRLMGFARDGTTACDFAYLYPDGTFVEMAPQAFSLGNDPTTESPNQ